MLVEQFGTVVIIVPESDMTAEEGSEYSLSVVLGGHPSHARGMLADGYDQVFSGEAEEE
jgi:hypothetical protein